MQPREHSQAISKALRTLQSEGIRLGHPRGMPKPHRTYEASAQRVTWEHIETGICGVQEAATLLGVSKQLVVRWAERYEDFPRPVACLKAGRLWSRTELLAWAELRGAA